MNPNNKLNNIEKAIYGVDREWPILRIEDSEWLIARIEQLEKAIRDHRNIPVYSDDKLYEVLNKDPMDES